MSTEKPKQEEKLAAATQADEILQKTIYDALMKATPDQVITTNPDAELVKGNARNSTAWRHAPAQIELLSVAQKRLTRAANQAGLNVVKVERVHACILKGTKLLVINPAPSTDLSAFEINRPTRGSTAWINLFPLLGPAGFVSDPGTRERFDVAYVPKGSPLWPGIVIDLGASRERRLASTKKSDGSNTQA